MSCEAITQQINNLKNTALQRGGAFRDLRSQINGINQLAAGQSIVREIQRARDLVNAMRVLITQSNNDVVTARNLASQARTLGCGTNVVNAALEVVGLSETIISNAASSVSQGERAIRTLEQNLNREQAAASDAATRENNAGTGTPGTAGQGPSATPNSDQLNELEIQSKRVPEEVEVTGTRRAEDGLDEVQVTGKRNPTLISGDPAIPDQVNVDVEEPNFNLESDNTNRGLSGQKANARAQATIQDTTNFEQFKDWRVRLALSPGADYLYKAPEGQRGILDPLSKTNGVVFPYTPSITVSYAANYDEVTPTHSNYKILQYTNSNVDMVTISCDFTAQDVLEANYLLAVIHFFRSVTKMWYGQDQFPKPGTPPPLVYLFGLGEFQFNAHPLVVKNFTYALPNDVDYIRAGTPTTNPGVNKAPSKQTEPTSTSSGSRLQSIIVQIGKNFLNSILPGGEPGPANFTPGGFNAVIPAGTVEPTYVPTKINLILNCQPIVSRNEISNNFSLKDYGTGKLLRGVQRSGGGFW
jgi:hypothetical protein